MTAKSEIEKKKALGVFERLIKEHIQRTRLKYSNLHFDQLFINLLRPDILSYSTLTMYQEHLKALRDGVHHHNTKRFEEIYIAISIVPSKSSFSNGYLSFLNDLFNESGISSGGFDFAHWIFCHAGAEQGIHLTLLPDPKEEGNKPIFAVDLLTNNEKKSLGV